MPHVLALFAERIRPTPRPLPDDAAQALDALLTRRRQLVEMLTAERNRLLVARPAVRRDLSSTSATSSAACARPMTTCTSR
jgi:transposase